jgi:hypothetical protein
MARRWFVYPLLAVALGAGTRGPCVQAGEGPLPVPGAGGPAFTQDAVDFGGLIVPPEAGWVPGPDCTPPGPTWSPGYYRWRYRPGLGWWPPHRGCHRHGLACWPHQHGVGCGSLEAEGTLLFPSGRIPDGEPCLQGPPPPPVPPGNGYESPP